MGEYAIQHMRRMREGLESIVFALGWNANHIDDAPVGNLIAFALKALKSRPIASPADAIEASLRHLEGLPAETLAPLLPRLRELIESIDPEDIGDRRDEVQS